MFRFESLDIWKLSVDFGVKIYDIADKLPRVEIFGLGSQLRRAAVSISNNIAEGSGSASTKDFKNFLDISIKSTLEVASMLFFCEKKEYINEEKRSALYTEAETLIRKIRSFKNSLKL